MKTLKLVLKKKWYDMIDSGEKKEEYREIKPYWISRFGFISYGIPGVTDGMVDCAACNGVWDSVTFYRGYAKNRPSMTFKLLEIDIDKGRPEWGAVKGKEYYVIRIGERKTED